MRRILALSTFTLVSLMSLAANSAEQAALTTKDTDAKAADHKALSALLKVGETAINTRDFETFKPHLAKGKFTVITVDGKKFESLDAFKTYWDDLFKAHRTELDKIEVNPVADGPTEFLADNVGICHGTSNDKYFFKNGETKTMPERWTAVLLKEDGDWKISEIIFSASIFDNPIISTIKEETPKLLVFAGLGGLIVGALGMSAFGRKKN